MLDGMIASSGFVDKAICTRLRTAGITDKSPAWGSRPGDLTGGHQVARGRALTRQAPRWALLREQHPFPAPKPLPALVELLPCPRPERVVEVRHSDIPPLAMTSRQQCHFRAWGLGKTRGRCWGNRFQGAQIGSSS